MNGTLSSIPIAVSSMLTGSKKAVRFNGTLYVSPAMYDLIAHASPSELETLLAAISFIDMGSAPSFYDPLPMTTLPPQTACLMGERRIFSRSGGMVAE